jgi:hypothetical protein
MPGFSFKETMAGTFTRVGAPGERKIQFTVTARADSWLRHLRDRKARLEGTIDMEGVATQRPLRGEILMDPLIKRVIRYEFDFTGDDGAPYRFAGQKDVTIADPVASMTTLPAEVLDGKGSLVAHCLLKFDTRDLPGFLGSFRPRF